LTVFAIQQLVLP